MVLLFDRWHVACHTGVLVPGTDVVVLGVQCRYLYPGTVLRTLEYGVLVPD